MFPKFTDISYKDSEPSYEHSIGIDVENKKIFINIDFLKRWEYGYGLHFPKKVDLKGYTLFIGKWIEISGETNIIGNIEYEK